MCPFDIPRGATPAASGQVRVENGALAAGEMVEACRGPPRHFQRNQPFSRDCLLFPAPQYCYDTKSSCEAAANVRHGVINTLLCCLRRERVW